METPKFVDDLIVTLEYQADRSPRSCFVVFSSREEHVEVVIDCAETVFQETNKYEVLRLDQRLKSGDSQYAELTDLLSSCCFAIVILDGFRPNVLFEYGILKGLGKPCIVLMDDKATVDIQGFLPSDVQEMPLAPAIDMDRHFSDVKDRFYLRYDRNKPKQIRATLQAEYTKLEKDIEGKFLHSLFPHKEVIEKELAVHLTAIVDIFTKSDTFAEGDVAAIDLARSHVERIANENCVTFPHRYFSTLARTYAKANAVDKAVAVIDGALAGGSDDALLLADKAYVLLDAGRSTDAIQALNAGIKLIPKAEFLWHNKAITLDKLGKTKEAMKSYKKAIALKSDCETIHYHYGVLLYDEKDFTSALKEFDRALLMKPEDTVFLLWKARALASSNRAEEARNIVETLIAEDSLNPDTWFVLGRMEADDAKALEAFHKAVHLDPNHGGALCSSAACLSNVGEYEQAIEIFFKMTESCPLHETCTTLIANIWTTFWKIGQPEKGIERCDRILADNPGHCGALAGKVACLALMETYEAALVILDNLLNDIPDGDGELWYIRACICAHAKDAGEATRSLWKAIEIDPRYEESARDDADFDPVRRTKVFREAFGLGTKPQRKSSASTRARPKQMEGRKCSTKASSRRPKGRG